MLAGRRASTEANSKCAQVVSVLPTMRSAFAFVKLSRSVVGRGLQVARCAGCKARRSWTDMGQDCAWNAPRLRRQASPEENAHMTHAGTTRQVNHLLSSWLHLMTLHDVCSTAQDISMVSGLQQVMAPGACARSLWCLPCVTCQSLGACDRACGLCTARRRHSLGCNQNQHQPHSLHQSQ